MKLLRSPRVPVIHLGRRQKSILKLLVFVPRPLTPTMIQEQLDYENYFSVWRSLQIMKKHNLVKKIDGHRYVVSEEGYKEYLRRWNK